jgi:hypothetical protein
VSAFSILDCGIFDWGSARLQARPRSKTSGSFLRIDPQIVFATPEGFVASAIENPAIENRKSND